MMALCCVRCDRSKRRGEEDMGVRRVGMEGGMRRV